MPNDDLDGIGLVGRRDLDGLEAAFEGGDPFSMDLRYSGGRGCADALDFAAAEGGP